MKILTRRGVVSITLDTVSDDGEGFIGGVERLNDLASQVLADILGGSAGNVNGHAARVH
jgi:hypothetical protein